MTEFQKAMQFIIDNRGGKFRVPDLLEHQYTFWVDEETWESAIADKYINEDCTVTNKFREEYAHMFDKVGKIKQGR